MTNSDKACRAIQSAKSESQVIAAVREYLDTLEAADAAQLPAELLALSLAPAEELIQSALQVLHNRMADLGAGRGGIVRETSLVFTTAARRLAALAKDTA